MATFQRDLDVVRILRGKAVELQDFNLALMAHNFRLDGRCLRWAAWGDKIRDKTTQNTWEPAPNEVAGEIIKNLDGSYQGLLLAEDSYTPEVGSYEVYWKIEGIDRARVYVKDFDSGIHLEGSATDRALELIQAYQDSYDTAERILASLAQTP